TWLYPRPKESSLLIATHTLLAAPLERKHSFPILLHADHVPGLPVRLRHQRIREGADPGPGPVSILTRVVVVVDEHHETGAAAGLGAFEHLAVAVRVPERGQRFLPDKQLDVLRLAVLVVEQQEQGESHENRPPVLVGVPGAQRRTDHLPGGNAVNALAE